MRQNLSSTQFFEDLLEMIRAGKLEVATEALLQSFEQAECDYRLEAAQYQRRLRENRLLELSEAGQVSAETERNRLAAGLYDLLQRLLEDEDIAAWFYRGRLNLRLLSIDDRVSEQDFYVVRKCMIGRDEACDIVVEDQRVSRRHAELLFFDRRVWVRDLGSDNGTFLDGLQLTENLAVTLKSGCIISAADVEFRVEIDFEAPLPGVLTALR
ncbi:MAG: FHA domain-containing protein [Saprospiraceae bacterium]|nr:FHA domain-containing protein [Saprospiraceae bacterium]